MMRYSFLIFCAIAVCISSASSAWGECVTLPGGVESVEEEAFSGCGSIREITLPEGVRSVAADAFADTGETVWIHCPPGDAALALLTGGADVDAGSVYRALVISQTYEGTAMELDGPENDSAAVGGCLSSLSRAPYQVTQLTDLTASEILGAVSGAFSAASEYDVSFLYYSGHGEAGGVLLGTDDQSVTPQQLRAAMDAVPGRKVIVVDACFSGGILTDEEGNLIFRAKKQSESGDSRLASFNDAFLSAFTNVRTRSGSAGAFGQYYVMTSARATEYCAEDAISSGGCVKTMGVFTYYLCRGCGWDGVCGAPVSLYADANADGVVSFAEAFSYAARNAKLYYSLQNAQSNMGQCASFSPFR